MLLDEGLKVSWLSGAATSKAAWRSCGQCLKELHAARYELLTTTFNLSLIEGLLAEGRLDEGLALIDETVGLIEANGDLVFMPELLRVKGNALVSSPQSSIDEAERCFRDSLECGRLRAPWPGSYGLLSTWRQLLLEQKRNEEAKALLQPVFERFDKGFDTADLKIGRRLLATL